ncbi:MAG: hypothetical protein ABI645_12560 [Pseudomonadota bacterium]
MRKGGGKGRVSNDLVAASCAAVLAVYAAGYSRTRDEARRLETQAQTRKPPRQTPPATAVPGPAVIETVASTAPVQEPPPTTSTPVVPAKAPVAVIKPPPVVAASQAISAPAAPAIAAVSATSTIEAAPTAAPVPEPAPALALAGKWRDGSYTGWGTSRHGDIKARVVIKNGRIVESSIDSCETAYPCDVIEHIVNQPVARQSAEVDRVSRATESADAYYFAVASALDDALDQPANKATISP